MMEQMHLHMVVDTAFAGKHAMARYAVTHAERTARPGSYLVHLSAAGGKILLGGTYLARIQTDEGIYEVGAVTITDYVMDGGAHMLMKGLFAVDVPQKGEKVH